MQLSLSGLNTPARSSCTNVVPPTSSNDKTWLLKRQNPNVPLYLHWKMKGLVNKYWFHSQQTDDTYIHSLIRLGLNIYWASQPSRSKYRKIIQLSNLSNLSIRATDNRPGSTSQLEISEPGKNHVIYCIWQLKMYSLSCTRRERQRWRL